MTLPLDIKTMSLTFENRRIFDSDRKCAYFKNPGNHELTPFLFLFFFFWKKNWHQNTIKLNTNKLQTDLHYLHYLSLVSLVKCATSLIFTSSYDGRGQTFPPYQPSLAKISNSGTAIKCCYMLLIDFSYSTAKKWIIEQQSDFKQQGWHLWGNPLTKKFLADPSRLQTYSITLSPAIRMQCHSLQLLPVKQLASHP